MENQAPLVDHEDTFSLPELSKAQNEVAVYGSASRAILVHICQRLARLENLMRNVQNDVVRLRSDVSKSASESLSIKEEVSGVHGQVDSLSSRLNDVASVVDLFQNEMNNQRNSVTSLSTSVQDERVRLTAVDVKVDNQRDEFDSRIQELNLKLDEIPRALAALQRTGGRDPFAGFTFRAAEKDKLSLGKHLNRGEAGARPGGAPFTDLQPFTIPDDMKEKIEMKIRQKEASKSAEEKRAAAELANAYRRLQLAGYPRVTEINMHVEQCREEIKRAFEFINTSNLQLYACCSSKVERVDLTSIQTELKSLRNKVRDFETRGAKASHGPHADTQPPASGAVPVAPGKGSGLLSTWNLDKYFNQPKDVEPDADKGVRISAAQVPELRVSLLELSKNLNALRQKWAKRHVQPLNPVVKHHLDMLLSLLNDGYSLTAEEPVDLARVETHVEKIAGLLGSEFSQQILAMMSSQETRLDNGQVAGEAVVQALDRYARSFTEAMAVGGSSGKGSTATQHATTMRAIHDQKRQLDQLRTEIEKLAENQRTSVVFPTPVDAVSPSGDVPASAIELRFATQQQQLYGLHEQLQLLRQQAIRQEEAYGELVRQLEMWRKDRIPISGISGHRVTSGVAQQPHAIQHGSPLSAALRRNNSNSGGGGAELDAYLAIIGADERPKSQAKLDPLHIKRVGSGASTGRTTISVPSVPVARNGVVHKIQTRSQNMRPKSGVHHGAGDPS